MRLKENETRWVKEKKELLGDPVIFFIKEIIRPIKKKKIRTIAGKE